MTFVLAGAAQQVLRDRLPLAFRIEANRFDRIDGPLVLATDEALANALCHRDYPIGSGSIVVAIYNASPKVTSSGTAELKRSSNSRIVSEHPGWIAWGAIMASGSKTNLLSCILG